MRKLQNNFTTMEQSKRLLELGMPADSADMVYVGDRYCKNYDKIPDVIRYTYTEYCERDNDYQSQCDYPNFHSFIPCWSAGRLMEIFDICSTENNTTWLPYCELDEDYITYIMHLYEQGKLDFSKLEE